MTIEDCIKELLINKEDDTYVLEKETIDFAIDTMRKCQKIQQIVENVDKRYYGYSTMMDYLHEVVEDGKIV